MDYSTVSESRLTSLVRTPRVKQAMGFLIFELAYFFAYLAALSFSREFITPFWFPDTVLLSALLLSRPRNWWIYIIGALPIRLFSPFAHDPAWFSLAALAIDSAKGILVAIALRRFTRHPPRLESVQEFGIFCFFAVLVAPAAAAFVRAGLSHLRGYPYWETWQSWFLADSLTHAVVTPAILYWLSAVHQGIKMPGVLRALERAALAAGLIWSIHLSFTAEMNGKDFPASYFYAVFPFLLWAVIRFGMEGASGAAAIFTVLSFKGAIAGEGPFFGKSPGDAALILQEFLLFRLVPLYLVAILMQQRDDAEHSLRESERRFHAMADTAPVLIWMAGTDKLCDFFNRGWLEFTGRTMEQELGYGWAEGIHPDDLQRCLKIYHTCFEARERFEMEYRLRRHDGQYRWILDRGVPRYGTNGKFLGYVGSVMDLTDRKRAEEARQNLVHASRLAVMGEFTAMVAHELNQPLNATLLNLDTLNIVLGTKIEPSDESWEILADVRKDNLRATETIRRIRALVSKHEMKTELVDMNKMVLEVVDLARGDTSRRGIEIRSECDASLPNVRGDAVQLQQVILNLLVNGMDAMKDNPESDRRLFVSTACNAEGFIEVAVKDIGHGIQPENLSRIFDSFFTTKPQGMGIGLSLARSIVQMHSGRLWAENNRDGKGTTFRFILPPVVSVPPDQATLQQATRRLADTV